MVVLHSGFIVGALIEVWWGGRDFPAWGWAMLALAVATAGLSAAPAGGFVRWAEQPRDER